MDKLFYSLPEFHALGGPGKVTAYKLAEEGKLAVVKTAHGRVGVTREEALRYLAGQPLAEAGKRDLTKAANASAASRRRAG